MICFGRLGIGRVSLICLWNSGIGIKSTKHSVASYPISLDEWAKVSSRKGFAQVCILIDVEKQINPRAKVRVKSNLI